MTSPNRFETVSIMHPILIDYFKRFQKEPSWKFDFFFTQLKLDEYTSKLPYVYGIELFCLRLVKALMANEKVCIFSDYDTDAVTATAVMYWGLVHLGFDPKNISFYSPDRFSEGYGMNLEAVEKLSLSNQLIISVDCGINSIQEANLVLKQPSCDLIITDHHHLHGKLPKSLTVVNPRLAGYITQKQLSVLEPKINFELDNITNNKKILNFYNTWVKKTFVKKPDNLQVNRLLSESITGVGVAWFCVVWLSYFIKDLKENIPQLALETKSTSSLNSLLGFVAIGTIADCQSILEPTNRLLVRTGLKIISTNQYSYLGLQALMVQTGLQDKINQGYILTSQDLGFILSPILNASGRISHAKLSIQTLLSDNRDKANLLANELIATNEERKNIVKTLTTNLTSLVATQISQKQQAIWLEGDWNKGIIGLLASKFVNGYNLPCIVISNQQESCTASLRAPEGYHLVKALQTAENLLEKFGGHPGAAGFTCLTKNLLSVKQLLLENFSLQANNIVKPIQNYATGFNTLPDSLKTLATQPHFIWLKQQDLQDSFFEKTWLLDPFGQDLPMPKFIFALENYAIRWLGSENKHLKLIIQNNHTITAFNISEEIKQTMLAKKYVSNLWIEAKLTQNTWNGCTKNELIADNIWVI